eukprot:c33028_g1_i1 orf=258-779(-)
MDALFTKASALFLGRRAQQEFSSFGDDVNSLSTTVEEGAKNFFNRIKGRIQTSLPEMLQAHGLPKGLFPKNVTHYELEEDGGRLTVFLPSNCEVRFKDSSILRYGTTVTAIMSPGKLTSIEGMKTKVLVWVNVSSISVEDPTTNKIYFGVGLKKSRPLDAYEVLRDGLEVEEF